MISIRKIGSLGRTYRHFNRYSQIVGALVKYGFGDLIERLNIDQFLAAVLNMVSEKSPMPVHARQSSAARIRMALEELGPTYIKLGQLLSTRPDFVDVDLIDELARLQDNVAPLAYDEVEAVFRREFGETPDAVFAEFDREPLASASIGQVHRARLSGGEEVAVKIQRPGIQSVVEVDLEIMLHLATLMEHHVEEIALHRPVRIVEEFTRLMERELDYANEAASVERFARQFLGDDTVRVPRIHRPLCGERVLVMEYVEGIRLTDMDALDAAGIHRKRLVARGANLFLRQIFDHGFFHGDPHPGNLRALPGDILCLYDFGMMGRIDRIMRAHFVDLVYAVVQGDEVRATRVLLGLTECDASPDLRLLERDVNDLMGQYLHRPLGEIEVGRLLRQMLQIAGHHRMRIPPGIFLMLKVLSLIESIASRLDPDFDMAAHAAPFIRREKLERYAPRRLAEQMGYLTGELATFLREFPKDILEVVNLIKSQKLSVRFEHHGLEPMVETHDRISNKLAFAIIIAALIIGSSIIIITDIPPLVHGISLIGICVFTAAVVMGIWLMIAILRSGRL